MPTRISVKTLSPIIAISLDENYAKAYLNRGISKQMKRDEDGACADWQKAFDLGIELAKKYLMNDCY